MKSLKGCNVAKLSGKSGSFEIECALTNNLILKPIPTDDFHKDAEHQKASQPAKQFIRT